MASRVDLLVANLLQTSGDALYIVPGERLFMTRGDVRAVVGREPVGEESFRAVVEELVPGSVAEELSRARHRLAWEIGPDVEAVEIRFGQHGGECVPDAGDQVRGRVAPSRLSCSTSPFDSSPFGAKKNAHPVFTAWAWGAAPAPQGCGHQR